MQGAEGRVWGRAERVESIGQRVWGREYGAEGRECYFNFTL
jgi:hypothetical protein